MKGGRDKEKRPGGRGGEPGWRKKNLPLFPKHKYQILDWNYENYEVAPISRVDQFLFCTFLCFLSSNTGEGGHWPDKVHVGWSVTLASGGIGVSRRRRLINGWVVDAAFLSDPQILSNISLPYLLFLLLINIMIMIITIMPMTLPPSVCLAGHQITANAPQTKRLLVLQPIRSHHHHHHHRHHHHHHHHNRHHHPWKWMKWMKID